MAAANRCSSRRAGPLGLVASLIALAGCTGQGSLLNDGLRRITLQDAPAIVSAPPAKPASSGAPAALRTTLDTQAAAAVVEPASAAVETSAEPAWCTYLREDTAAQTTIMRSPSLSGSVQDDGKSSVSLGVSISDFGKASVLDETAKARCRKYMAETGLQKLVFLSPQGLTNAGFKAKASAILSRKGDIQKLRAEASRLLQTGDLSRERATAITAMADTLMAGAHEAQSLADRRTGDFLGAKDKASILGRELLRAESEIEDLNSRMRSYDAMDVSVSAGWHDDLTPDAFTSSSSDFSGKLSVSVKLGALNPQRFDHEERAKAAKLRSISVEEGGALWQINVLRLAHERAISGLEQSQHKLDAAIGDAERLLKLLTSTSNPEFAGNVISAKLQLFSLKAERAAVSGSLGEIRVNLKRLQTQG